MSRLLEVSGLTKSFGGPPVVDGVTLGVGEGERVALIGPNGAGKSTCFNMLSGQLTPNAGSVRFQGREITALPPRAIWRQGVGRTFQVAAAFGSMTVAENVQMALVSHHGRLRALWPRFARLYREEAAALLARVGLEALAGRSCAELAYGDLKRLDLAVALAHGPRLLLMDEPTAGMAPAERGRLMELVSALVAERALGVLFTEHDMDVVFGHADRVLVLDRGVLIADGTPEAVRADPRVRAVYLGEAG